MNIKTKEKITRKIKSVYKLKKTDKEIREELPTEIQTAIEILKSYGYNLSEFKVSRKEFVKQIRFGRMDSRGIDTNIWRRIILHLREDQIHKITHNRLISSAPVIELVHDLKIPLKLPRTVKTRYDVNMDD